MKLIYFYFILQMKSDWSEPELILAVKEYTPKVIRLNNTW